MKHLIPIASALLAASIAHAEDVPLKNCPPRVRETIKSELGNGKLDDIERVHLKGRTRYIVEIDVRRGGDLKLLIRPDGKLLSTATDTSYKFCPAKVRRAIDKHLEKNGKLDDIDILRSGGFVRYHVEIDRRGQPDLELTISRDGKIHNRRKGESDTWF